MENKSKKIEVRVSPNEYTKIVYNANNSQFKTISSYVRHAAIHHETIVIDVSELLKMSEELHRQGNNLNQIAKHANTTGTLNLMKLHDVQLRYVEILAQLKSINESLIQHRK